MKSPDALIPTNFNYTNLTALCEARYPQVIQVAKICGLLTESDSHVNVYNGQEFKDNFSVIWRHNLSVLANAIGLADFLGLSTQERDDVAERAGHHDSPKPWEIMRRNAYRGSAKDPYSEQAYAATEQLFLVQGIEPQLAKFLAYEAGKETGHNSLPQFVERTSDTIALISTRENLVSRIVHYADETVHTFTLREEPSFIVTPGERMNGFSMVKGVSGIAERYQFMQWQGFGFNPDNQIVRIPNPQIVAPFSDSERLANKTDWIQSQCKTQQIADFRTYADWQIWIAEEMAEDFTHGKRSMDIPATEYLRDEIIRRLATLGYIN